MNIYELGLALKQARIENMMTQSELANITGVSLSSVSGLERGVLSEIGTVKLIQLFAALGLELAPRLPRARRTLDDVRDEMAAQRSVISKDADVVSGSTIKNGAAKLRLRVRHAKKQA